MIPQLFSREQAPRRPRRILMRVIDAGQHGYLELKCRKCGHHEEHLGVEETISAANRLRPCPVCNSERKI